MVNNSNIVNAIDNILLFAAFCSRTIINLTNQQTCLLTCLLFCLQKGKME